MVGIPHSMLRRQIYRRTTNTYARLADGASLLHAFGAFYRKLDYNTNFLGLIFSNGLSGVIYLRFRYGTLRRSLDETMRSVEARAENCDAPISVQCRYIYSFLLHR